MGGIGFKTKSFIQLNEQLKEQNCEKELKTVQFKEKCEEKQNDEKLA